MTAGEPDILITGATGFVGTAVLRELAGRGMGPRVRVLVRRPVPGWMTEAGVTAWCGDLTEAEGLAGACTGISTLVHLASQVGGEPALCTAVNEVGTANLLAEARRAGTAHVLYLSTCAVYRDGVHQGAEVPGSGPRAGARLVADLGPSTSRASSAVGVAADLRPPPARRDRADGGLRGEFGSLTSGDWSATERRGSGAGLPADPGAPPGGSGLRAGSELVAGPGPPTCAESPPGEHRAAGSGSAASPGAPPGGSGLRAESGVVADPANRDRPVGERTAELGPPTCAESPAGEHPESALVTDPSSPTSRSRLAGERLVLAAGGSVLRPHLIHGPGDRHFVPALVRWIRAVPAWAAGGVARTSVVAVADLAAAIAVLALDPGRTRPGEVLHVADPRPIPIRGLVTAVCELLGLPLPTADLPLDEHRARTRAALPSLTDHQYSLLTRDHWYESSRIWELTGVAPRPRLAEAADWYRRSLQGSGS